MLNQPFHVQCLIGARIEVILLTNNCAKRDFVLKALIHFLKKVILKLLDIHYKYNFYHHKASSHYSSQ